MPASGNNENRSAVPTMPAQLFYRSDAALAEGPVWDAGTLWWVDITGKAVFAKRDAETEATRYDVGVEVGALALWQPDHLVLATDQGFQAYDLNRRQLEPWHNPEPELRENRFNDGKCDPRGRFVAGTYHRGAQPGAALYSLGTDGRVQRILAPVTCSNGLAWDEAGTTLYYIDTRTRAVRAFAYDLAQGTISDERVVVTIPPETGLPDGMTIDRTGNLWISLWNGWAVECWDPRTGERRARIELPVARVTSCVFGGPRYDSLFITTARGGLSAEEQARQPRAGSIFCAKPGATGYPAVRFQG
jgi:sugar lactone lactonase YvrE